jgi:GNAT superfamily N-acetyltransferase
MTWQIRHVDHTSSEQEKQEVLRFSTGDYTWATNSRLSEPWGNEIYGFVAAFDGSRCVGTTSYAISPRKLGILSQVFTDPDYRGQGIATATVEETVKTFRQHNTSAAYLASGQEWVRQMYRKVGFEFVGAMGRRHGFKLTLESSGHDRELFRAGQDTGLRHVQPDDQGDICALFNAGHNCVVKHYALGCYLGSYFEGEFYSLRRREGTKGYRSMILDGQETILGMATVLPSDRRHQTHRGVLDWLVHPEYHSHTQNILDSMLSNCALKCLDAFADSSETARQDLLEKNGFEQVGQLPDQIQIDDVSFTVIQYRRQL